MRNYPSEQEARELICEIGKRLFEKNMVAANDGNITVKIADDRILVTPSGVSKGYMKPEMMSVTDSVGRIISRGTPGPSSEIKIHLRVFSEDAQAGACVHAHPVNATAYAVTGEWLDSPILTESAISLGAVPVAPYAAPGTEAAADSVAPFVRGHNCCLLSFHGALTWGEDLIQAYYRMETLEHYAMINTAVRYIMNSKRVMTPEQTAACVENRGRSSSHGGAPTPETL